MAKDIWKDIPGYEGCYQCSIFGQVRSLTRDVVRTDGSIQVVAGKDMKLIRSRSGYYVVTLCLSGKQKMKSVHRIVAETFIPNPENKPQVNHIDGDKSNNCIDNLEWATAAENNEHAWKHNLNRNHPIQVAVTDMQSGEVTIYDSILDASIKLGCNSVGQHLENGTPYKHYKFKYVDDTLDKKVSQIIQTKQPIGGNKSLPIRCVTTNETFPSIRKCSEHFHIDGETIRRALRYSSGYVRKYKLKFEFI